MKLLPHLFIQLLLYYLSSGGFQKVKNKQNQTFSSRGGCSLLQEVPNIVISLQAFGILRNLSLRRSGRLREVVATEASTVVT